MKKNLKILFASPEVVPFSKTNISAEFSFSYPKKLKDLGHDVRIITPQYMAVNERKYTLRDVIRLKDIDVKIGSDVLKINVKSAFLPDTKVQVYFIDYKPYFFREGLYIDPKTNNEYSDNDKRFILFSKAVMETLKKLQWQPDVIHCNGWQTGLIPFLLKYIYKKESFFQPVSTLYTIRDFIHQGNFDSQCTALLGLETETSDMIEKFCNGDTFNFLEAGIKTAHCINSTSIRYNKLFEKEIENRELLKLGSEKLHTIKDEIDCSLWNSEKDPYIPVKFDEKKLENKTENKKALLKMFNLKYKDIPAFVINSSFIDEFGLDLINESFKTLLDMNIYLIVLISKEVTTYPFLKEMKKKNKDHIGLQEYYDVTVEHLSIAGADVILLPSKYDTGSISSGYSINYGAVPVVYEKAIADQYILQYDIKHKKGNGFVFTEFTRDSFISILKRIMKIYNDDDHWLNIVKNGMTRDCSQENTIKKYEKLYNKCIKSNVDC